MVEPSSYWPEVPLSGALMQKLSYFHLSAALPAFAALVGVEARSAELEGALQYPPPSVARVSNRHLPGRTVPQLVSPKRIDYRRTADR